MCRQKYHRPTYAVRSAVHHADRIHCGRDWQCSQFAGFEQQNDALKNQLLSLLNGGGRFGILLGHDNLFAGLIPDNSRLARLQQTLHALQDVTHCAGQLVFNIFHMPVNTIELRFRAEAIVQKYVLSELSSAAY
ncbi:conserved hypothetical protein [Trichinella spiralis]|uniref:hypothetical protein n=1 Tax=Trichinella spiralis TaxID=6334 RepID=UPI0001EFC6B0|nr:conserved hypothetical protein [Trichinella spiralis]